MLKNQSTLESFEEFLSFQLLILSSLKCFLTHKMNLLTVPNLLIFYKGPPCWISILFPSWYWSQSRKIILVLWIAKTIKITCKRERKINNKNVKKFSMMIMGLLGSYSRMSMQKFNTQRTKEKDILAIMECKRDFNLSKAKITFLNISVRDNVWKIA